MKYPLMNRQPERTVEIPAFSGGLNLRDGENAILDNQLSEAKNVWFKNSRLKTRPGMRFNEGNFTSVRPPIQNMNGFKVHKDIVNAEGLVLVSWWGWYFADDPLKKKPVVELFWSDGTEFGYVDGAEIEHTEFEIPTYFMTCHNGIVYCFLSCGRIYKKGIGDSANFELVNIDDLYIPLVATNGLNVAEGEYQLDKFESHNSIGRYAKIKYSGYNPAYAGSDTQKMYYYLPYTWDDFSVNLLDWMNFFKDLSPKITVKIAYADGTVATHTLTVDINAEFSAEASYNPTDNLLMVLRNRFSKPVILFTKTGIDHAEPNESIRATKNNIEITYPAFSKENYSKIFNMARCEWYGGASEGINGGTRLFLCGNKQEKNKNLVVWSDLNNPLYFPDSAYFRVGDELHPVTAFGKQNDMLIIFKDNEIYSTQYTRGDSVSAAQVIEGGVSYQSSSVYFPLTLLHSKIGCDIPNSVQLCKNRLVWANTNGNIYTLVSQNQYSERNVFSIGEMLKPKLKGISGLATSADVEGMYWLLDSGKMFVIDYNSYGYSYVSGYSKDEDSNLKIPSWYFELPRSGDVFEDRGRLRMLRAAETYENSGRTQGLFLYDFIDCQADLLAHEGEGGLYNETEEKEIEFFFKTKLFDFGHPELTKNINSVNFSLSAAPVGFEIAYITENTQSDNEIITVPGIVGKILNLVFRPLTRLNTHFGIKISGSGTFEGDSLKINYKTAGGAK